MEKTYFVEGKIFYNIFDEDSGWYDDYEWFDMTVEGVERDEVEEYVKTHKPRPKWLNGNTQYKITGIEVVRIKDNDEEEAVEIDDDDLDLDEDDGE